MSPVWVNLLFMINIFCLLSYYKCEIMLYMPAGATVCWFYTSATAKFTKKNIYPLFLGLLILKACIGRQIGVFRYRAMWPGLASHKRGLVCLPFTHPRCGLPPRPHGRCHCTRLPVCLSWVHTFLLMITTYI